MPSDDRSPALARALEALAAPREAFDSALALTAEEVRGFLDSHRDPEGDEPARVAAELGVFASAHIDADRFASLVDLQRPVDIEVLHDAEKGWAGLLALRDRGEELHVVRVPAGGELVQAVRDALAEAGRAFGLTRAVRFVRNGSGPKGPQFGDPFPPRLWSAAERSLAPPLVVEVDGGDLRVSGLGDLLEGKQKLILVVRGPATRAPLARLIRPGLLVVQATEAKGFGDFAGFEGPAVAAVMPEGMVFSHDPRRGSTYARRLVVESPLEDEDATDENVKHLSELANLGAAPPPAPAPVTEEATEPAPEAPPGTSNEPTDADRLAGWLLEQAGL